MKYIVSNVVYKKTLLPGVELNSRRENMNNMVFSYLE